MLDFQFEGNSKYRPRRLIFERRFNRGFFSVTSLGAYTWRDLFSEFYGIYHDEFFILIIYVRVISCTYIFITMANPFPHSSPGEGSVGVATALNPVPFRLVTSMIVIRVRKIGPDFQTKSHFGPPVIGANCCGVPTFRGGASHVTLVPLHLLASLFLCVCVCCITNLYCIH